MSTSLCLIEHCENRLNEITRGLFAQFYGDTGRGSLGLVYKINVQRVFHRRIEWMVVRNICLFEFKPSSCAFTTAIYLYFFNDHCAHIQVPFQLSWQSRNSRNIHLEGEMRLLRSRSSP